MRYLGLDCHKMTHAWALLDEEGHLLKRGTVANAPEELRRLRASFSEELCVGLEGPRGLRGAVEVAFADCSCYEICAAWTHVRRPPGRRRPKNDENDALQVAKTLYEERDALVPLVPPEELRRALTITLRRHRRTVKDQRIVAQRLQALLTELWQGGYRELCGNPLGATGRRFFAAYTHPQQAASAQSLGKRLWEWSRGRMGQAHADRIQSIARTFGEPTLADELIVEEIRELLPEVDLLQSRRRKLEKRLREFAVALGYEWMLEEPGLGPVRVATLIAGGFLESPGADNFARLAGIAPVERSSGERTTHTNAWVRHQSLFGALMDWAQWLTIGRSNVPRAREYYERKRREGKTHTTALRCLAKQALIRLFKARDRHSSSRPIEVPHNEERAA